MKKVILAGLAAGLVMLGVSFALMYATNALFPALEKEYFNTAMYRSFSDWLMQIFFLHPFILGIIMAWFWKQAGQLVPGKSFWSKGLRFGLLYTLIVIPGLFITYTSFLVTKWMVLSWLVTGAIQYICAGWVIVKLMK